MKKLLLTSAGLVNKEISQVLLGELFVPIEKARILVVAYAQNKEEEFYINESKQELLNLGFKNMVVADMNYSINLNNKDNFEVSISEDDVLTITNKEGRTDTFKLTYGDNGVPSANFIVGGTQKSFVALSNIENTEDLGYMPIP